MVTFPKNINQIFLGVCAKCTELSFA